MCRKELCYERTHRKNRLCTQKRICQPGSADRILYEKNYLTKDVPMLSLQQIFDDIAESPKRKAIREKFDLAENHPEDHIKQKDSTRRKIM